MKTFFHYSFLLAAVLLFSSYQESRHIAHEYENFLEIDGMNVEWEFEGNLLKFKLHSPTQGWLSLGFNESNNVVNANLIMGAVVEQNTQMEEFYVLGFGDFQPMKAVGGYTSVIDFLGFEDPSGTSFQFTIDSDVSDDFHYNLKEGSKIWLICSYSLSDEFEEHSIMRRHLEITL